MKVILLRDVDNLGEADAVKDVSEGYARNFLLPRKLAILASKNSVASADKRRKVKEAQLAEIKAKMQAEADRLAGMEFTISAEVGESGKLFGAVTSADIAEAVGGQSGTEIDKKKVLLDEPIKLAGIHTVQVKLFQDIVASLKINIQPK